MRRFLFAVAIAIAGLATAASAEPIPKGWSAQNLRPIGFSSLDGRYGAFKLAIKKADNGKWYLYMGHLWHQGWTIVDVTDAANPKFIKFIPWPQGNTWTIDRKSTRLNSSHT